MTINPATGAQVPQNDRERLTIAFRALRKIGYFARQRFWCCQSCGWSAVPEDQTDRVAFYHKQDANAFDRFGNITNEIRRVYDAQTETYSRIIDPGVLYLAWSGDPAVIMKALADAGLPSLFDGVAAGTRIAVLTAQPTPSLPALPRRSDRG